MMCAVNMDLNMSPPFSLEISRLDCRPFFTLWSSSFISSTHSFSLGFSGGSTLMSDSTDARRESLLRSACRSMCMVFCGSGTNFTATVLLQKFD